ncbi:MAG TPA: hypothetical protein VG433_08535 [Pirellulales bacterium]|jgi:hypothetical protein|nr:hypothetical protein [Pirellulales bacterium]
MFNLAWRSLHFGLLAASCALAGGLVCLGQPVDSGDRNLQVERAVYQALERPVNVEVRGMGLADAVRAINRSCGVNFVLDSKGLKEAGVAGDTEICCEIQGSSADVALAVMLRPVELTWVVFEGQPLITTVSNAETMLDLRVYPVHDLIIARDEKGTYADFESLIDVVTSMAAPTTWSEVGGAGSIKPFFNSQSIVVTQTREVHLQVEGLLAALRRARDVQGLGGVAASAPPAASYVPAAAMPATARPASPSPTSRLVRVYE